MRVHSKVVTAACWCSSRSPYARTLRNTRFMERRGSRVRASQASSLATQRPRPPPTRLGGSPRYSTVAARTPSRSRACGEGPRSATAGGTPCRLDSLTPDAQSRTSTSSVDSIPGESSGFARDQDGCVYASKGGIGAVAVHCTSADAPEYFPHTQRALELARQRTMTDEHRRVLPGTRGWGPQPPVHRQQSCGRPGRTAGDSA